MKINVGHKDYGYYELSTETEGILTHYIENIAPKYKGTFTSKNMQLAKDILRNKKISFNKYEKILRVATISMLALTSMVDPDFAVTTFASDSIDLRPIDKLSSQIYWLMFKSLLYITTPLYAYVGYILLFAGASTEKRKRAKELGITVAGATGVVAGAPWVAKVFYNAWVAIFN